MKMRIHLWTLYFITVLNIFYVCWTVDTWAKEGVFQRYWGLCVCPIVAPSCVCAQTWVTWVASVGVCAQTWVTWVASAGVCVHTRVTWVASAGVCVHTWVSWIASAGVSARALFCSASTVFCLHICHERSFRGASHMFPTIAGAFCEKRTFFLGDIRVRPSAQRPVRMCCTFQQCLASPPASSRFHALVCSAHRRQTLRTRRTLGQDQHL